jgi:cyclase
MRLTIQVFILCILTALVTPAQELTLTKLGGHSFVLSAQKGYWTVNSIVIEAADKLVVIDTLPSPEYASKALKRIREISDKPIRFVVNTHCHADHFFGNEVFADAVILGNRYCLEESEAEPARIGEAVSGAIARWDELYKSADPDSDKYGMIEGMLEFLRHMKANLESGFQPTPPNLVFDGEACLALEGITIRLIPSGPLHSKALLAVYVPEERVLAVPGLFHPQSLPELDAEKGPDAASLYSILKKLVDACPEAVHVVPGHGGISNIEDLKSQTDYLGELISAVKETRGRGLTLDQALEEIRLESFSGYGNYSSAHPNNIREEWKRQETNYEKEKEQ